MVDVVPDYATAMLPYLQQLQDQDSGRLPGMSGPGYGAGLSQRFGVGPAPSPYDQLASALHRIRTSVPNLNPGMDPDSVDAQRAAQARQPIGDAAQDAWQTVKSAAGPVLNFSPWRDPQAIDAQRATQAQQPIGEAARDAWNTAASSANPVTAGAIGTLGALYDTVKPQPAGAGEDTATKNAAETDERQKAIDRLWQDAEPRKIPDDLNQRINELTQRAADKSVPRSTAQGWRAEAAKMRDDWQQQENKRQADAKTVAQQTADAFASEKDSQAKAIADEKLTFAHQHPMANDLLNAAGYGVAVGLPLARRGFALGSAANLENRANSLANEWDTLQKTVNSSRAAKSTISAARKNSADIASELKSTAPHIQEQVTAANPAEGFNWGNPSTYGKLLPNPVEAGLGGLAFYEGRALPHQIDYATLPAGNTQRDEAARWTPFSGNYDPRLLGSNMAQGAGWSMLGRDVPLPRGGASLPRIENIVSKPQYRRSSWNKNNGK